MKIVNLMAHGPAYESLRDPSLLLREWELPDRMRTPNGNDNRDWPAQLGHWVLEQRPDWSWEVRQPDTRAERVYSHTFDDGVVHCLFPAKERDSGRFRRGRLYMHSDPMLEGLATDRESPSVIVLHGLGAPLWRDVLYR